MAPISNSSSPGSHNVPPCLSRTLKGGEPIQQARNRQQRTVKQITKEAFGGWREAIRGDHSKHLKRAEASEGQPVKKEVLWMIVFFYVRF